MPSHAELPVIIQSNRYTPLLSSDRSIPLDLHLSVMHILLGPLRRHHIAGFRDNEWRIVTVERIWIFKSPVGYIQVSNGVPHEVQKIRNLPASG